MKKVGDRKFKLANPLNNPEEGQKKEQKLTTPPREGRMKSPRDGAEMNCSFFPVRVLKR